MTPAPSDASPFGDFAGETAGESIGVFGGSFDPPHFGHVLCCVYAKLACELDRVLVLPAGRHAFGKKLAPAKDRLAMVRLAFDDLPFCETSLVEVERAEREPDRPSYMVETLREIGRLNPGARLRLIVGTDLRGEIDKWRDAAEVARLAPPAWVPRAGFGEPDEHGGLAIPAWSSTDVRNALGAGRDATRFLPAAVLRYIRQRGLYA